MKEEARSLAGGTDFTTIQVVGSNGKGSVVHYLGLILSELSNEVVSLVSPHFVQPGERIKINNRPLPEEKFVQLLERAPRRWLEEFTPFEIFFLLALQVTGERNPDYLLLEAGMGGRWDATSAMAADITVLTAVEREHTEFLGETRREILEEKTAQVPENSVLFAPSFSGDCEGYLSNEISKRSLDFQPLEPVPDADEYNRRIACRVAGYLEPGRGDRIERASRESPLPPGREEKVEVENRKFILDVAHTPAAVSQLSRRMAADDSPGAQVVIFGCLEGKKFKEMLQELLEFSPPAEFIFTAPPSPRALDPAVLKEVVPPRVNVYLAEEPPEALQRAWEISAPGDQLVVTGSFALIGWFKQQWKS